MDEAQLAVNANFTTPNMQPRYQLSPPNPPPLGIHVSVARTTSPSLPPLPSTSWTARLPLFHSRTVLARSLCRLTLPVMDPRYPRLRFFLSFTYGMPYPPMHHICIYGLDTRPPRSLAHHLLRSFCSFQPTRIHTDLLPMLLDLLPPLIPSLYSLCCALLITYPTRLPTNSATNLSSIVSCMYTTLCIPSSPIPYPRIQKALYSHFSLYAVLVSFQVTSLYFCTFSFFLFVFLYTPCNSACFP